jgi:hypothetical protein
MEPFNWQIGRIPEGWDRKVGLPHIINGDFTHGERAAMLPASCLRAAAGSAAASVNAYCFYRDERAKVQAWLDWFARECDE